ncbi:vascular endothelial growth factor receptor 2 [Copidosoma floridanum]|uniref:vascular endothelial growth factor receptor 2 n=1 Tax=Copidosoma floridanum TaxID=29053 RepID=UPI000C6F68E3|nr:vascular endothelial growth factor receptor 2 [Copidosoma floridanum]
MKTAVRHFEDHPPSLVILVANKSAFIQILEEENVLISFHCVGYQAVFPCRTTSPKFNVTINAQKKMLLSREEINFDPKIGFVMKNTSFLNHRLEYYTMYTCKVNQDGLSQKIDVVLVTVRDSCVHQPIIKINAPTQITVGSTINMKCIVKIELGIPYHIFWETPRNSTFQTIMDPIQEEKSNIVDLITSELIRTNITYDDEGNYTCVVRSSLHENKVTKYIRVHNRNKAYINLSSSNETRHRTINDSVTFVVHVDAYPTPTLVWFDPSGKEIISRKKFTILNIKRTSSLTIRNICAVDDGIYTLRVNNSVLQRQFNFSLKVHAKPNVYIDSGSVKSYYSFNKNATFTCLAHSNPKSKISWYYKKCLESRKDCNTLELEGMEIYKQSNKITESRLTIDLQIIYGQINCTACNKHGCNSMVQEIHITDALPGVSFGIIKPNEVFEGDTIILTCAAVIHEFSSVRWLEDHGKKSTNYDKIIFKSDNTTFTHRATLLINGVSQSDEKYYHCEATDYDGMKKMEIYSLKVNEGAKPFMWAAMIVWSVIILTFLMVYIYLKVLRGKMKDKQLMKADQILPSYREGTIDYIYPEVTVDYPTELLFYDIKWEFPRKKLQFDKHLGSGAFGVVYKATAHGICSNESSTTVAVKMVRRKSDPIFIRALARELKIMSHLGQHLNVVNLLGACTKNIAKHEFLLITEFCKFGNLEDYLLHHRKCFINQIDAATGKINPSLGKLFKSNEPLSSYDSKVHKYCGDSQPDCPSTYVGDHTNSNLNPVCSQDLLLWAFQVTKGMDYLFQKKILHCDLAARNILLADNNIVKICDFGLAKNFYQDYSFEKESYGPKAVRWMSIESMRDGVFSTKSDVWSFGIVLWEFFTLAETPYSEMAIEQIYNQLIKGYRLEQPKYATRDIYEIMLSCWEVEPNMRPRFTDLSKSLGTLLENSVKINFLKLLRCTGPI